MGDKPKVYLVVPNLGTVIVPLIAPIFTMATDQRFDVTVCDFTRSYRRGLVYNKNMTVKDFLETDCEWFVSIDSDQFPMKNPLDLILSGREIIGLPTPISDGKIVIWNMFLHSKEKPDKYTPLMLSQQMLDNNTYPDLVECHAVGGGCVIVKREVMDKLYPPYKDITTLESELDLEHDLRFCKNARDLGYKVFFSPYYRCDHLKEISMLQFLDVKNRLIIQEEAGNG